MGETKKPDWRQLRFDAAGHPYLVLDDEITVPTLTALQQVSIRVETEAQALRAVEQLQNGEVTRLNDEIKNRFEQWRDLSNEVDALKEQLQKVEREAASLRTTLEAHIEHVEPPFVRKFPGPHDVTYVTPEQAELIEIGRRMKDLPPGYSVRRYMGLGYVLDWGINHSEPYDDLLLCLRQFERMRNKMPKPVEWDKGTEKR